MANEKLVAAVFSTVDGKALLDEWIREHLYMSSLSRGDGATAFAGKQEFVIGILRDLEQAQQPMETTPPFEEGWPAFKVTNAGDIPSN